MNPLSPSGCSLLIHEPGAPVVKFRSAEIAVPVRINGAPIRIAVRRSCVGARSKRVFQFLKWLCEALHVPNMERSSSEMSDKLSEKKEMCDVASAQKMLREGWPTGSVKERIRAASRSLQWSPTRTRDLWYGQARRVDAHEMANLHTFQSMRDRARDARERKAAHDAHQELDRALAIAAEHLARAVAQGDRDAAHALRQITSRMDLA